MQAPIRTAARKEHDAALADLQADITNSYANNSLLYRSLAEAASLEAITAFMTWDAVQPPFNQYLRLWLDKVPARIRPPLLDHIREEEEQQHSLLFRQMMAHLNTFVRPHVEIDYGQLTRLNYTFSPECAAEQGFGFFLGGFLATELMSWKRCGQVLAGLLRLGLDRKDLEYLTLHSEADADHWHGVRDLLIVPALAEEPGLLDDVRRGVEDRLTRSGQYLRWYEEHRLARAAG